MANLLEDHRRHTQVPRSVLDQRHYAQEIVQRLEADLLVILVSSLAFATVAVLVMEQAGTLKLGPQANEFNAGEDGGKVVKFEDVRGVEEAKEVCRPSCRSSAKSRRG